MVEAGLEPGVDEGVDVCVDASVRLWSLVAKGRGLWVGIDRHPTLSPGRVAVTAMPAGLQPRGVVGTGCSARGRRCGAML